jgi:gluconate 5-dehydrogenase
MYNLDGFTVIITGASGGLGFAMARALLQANASVAVTSRPGEKFEKSIAILEGEGLHPLAVPMDVRSEISINAAAAQILSHWDHVDMLVNNAGLGMGYVDPDFAVDPKPFYELNPNAFRDIVNTNFIGYFLVSREFVPLMVRRGKGRIVNISTSTATMTLRGMLPYGPSRMGAEAMSVIMTEELRDRGVTVNILIPGGPVDTGLIPDGMRDQFKQRVNLLSPDIMNEAILFLASPKAAGITGERITAKSFGEWLDSKNNI